LRERAAVETVGARIEAAFEATVQWVQAFKDVRLFLVAEALLQLEVEVNSALAQLGLADWGIRFAPDSETKAGAVKRGFSVTVLSPNNERAVPWQVWSGGEAQRLRVAASMGLSNLIAAYTGYKAFVEVWDEPTNGMSSQGIADLLTAMKDRAERDGKQVWIIDHRALDSGLFQQTITAVKCDGTTTLRRNENGQGE
jgi:DNA repair exonuclease SbcCD ATPase subunit